MEKNLKEIAIFLFALGAGLSSQMATATDRETCRAACDEEYFACLDSYPTEEYACFKASIRCHRECP